MGPSSAGTSSIDDRDGQAAYAMIRKGITRCQIVGAMTPLPFYILGWERNDPWPLLLGFSLVSILPTAYFFLRVLPMGRDHISGFISLAEQEHETRRSVMAVIILGSMGLAGFSAYMMLQA